MRCLAIIALLATACSNPPEEDYRAFRDRSESARNAPTEIINNNSNYHDLRGRWLAHALLSSGVEVGLWIEIETDGDMPPHKMTAKIRMHDDPDNDEWLVITESTIDTTGRFQLSAMPLKLPGRVTTSGVEVIVNLVLDSRTLSADNFCGDVLGDIIAPVPASLNGSTFSVHRNPDGDKDFKDLPFRCADLPPPVIPDAGIDDDGGTPRPEAPDLSDVESVRRDLTGNYFLNVKIGGALPLKLWLSLVYSEPTPGAPEPMTPPPGYGSLDGALRRATDVPGVPALATFSTTVDEDGRFDVWLPNFTIVGAVPVEADILLVGLTRPEGICGVAAGEVRKPLATGLDNTTFFGLPWMPGTAEPANAPGNCTDPVVGPDAMVPDAMVPDAMVPDAGMSD